MACWCARARLFVLGSYREPELVLVCYVCCDLKLGAATCLHLLFFLFTVLSNFQI